MELVQLPSDIKSHMQFSDFKNGVKAFIIFIMMCFMCSYIIMFAVIRNCVYMYCFVCALHVFVCNYIACNCTYVLYTSTEERL